MPERGRLPQTEARDRNVQQYDGWLQERDEMIHLSLFDMIYIDVCVFLAGIAYGRWKKNFEASLFIWFIGSAIMALLVTRK